MSNDQIIALIGATVLAFVVRFFNIVIQWLAKALGVNPPEPIPAGSVSDAVPPTTPVGDPPAPNVPPTP